MKDFLNSLLDLIYKKKCYFCSSSKYSLKMCPKCFGELIYNPISPNKIIDGINVFSCGIYEKKLQKLIRGVKYHNQKELAYYQAKFMYEYFIQLNDKRDFQVIPVPLHPKRLKKRKYNHMDLVAEEFCKLSKLTLNLELIKRIKNTKAQYKLSKEERIKNLSNAFAINLEKDLKKPILILDDICTTGATFEEIISTLKKNNLNEILCISTSSP